VNYVQLFLWGSGIIILVTLISLRRAHIRVEYSVSWLGVGLVLFICSFFSRTLVRVAGNLGLDPPICLILMAGALAVALLFEVSIVVSQLRDENVVLAQKLAILEYYMCEMQANGRRQTD
jgi:hypothetical protein